MFPILKLPAKLKNIRFIEKLSFKNIKKSNLLFFKVTVDF